MNKWRKIALIALTVCTAASATAAFAACEEVVYPDFKNPVDGVVQPQPTEGAKLYEIKVQSSGRLELNNVQVDVMKGTENVMSGSSRNGKIEAWLEPAEYELKINESTLPSGYYVPADAEYKTESKEEDGETTYTATISLPSAVIPTAATSATRYAVGDVMHDFGYTASDGTRYLLSELLETKKCVVLNFWYTSCTYCNQEFPDMHEVYGDYKDKAAFVALDSTDSTAAIKNYQEAYGYTDFHMAHDAAGITDKFGVTSFPTTFIVDRYGVVAFKRSGVLPKTNFRALLSQYTADNYTQDIVVDAPSSGGNEESRPNVQPNVAVPDHTAYKTRLGSSASDKVTAFRPETGENDAADSWPWVVETDGEKAYLSASNTGADPSFAILYVDLSLKKGDIVSYDYDILTNEYFDTIYVILNSETALTQYEGTSTGWQTENAIYTAHRDENITISFTYLKTWGSDKVTSAENYARIGNFKVENVEDMVDPVDFALSADEEGITLENIELGADGLYRITGTGSELDGNLLLVDLWGATSWSVKHTGAETFIPEDENGSYYASMYYISYWELSNVNTGADNLRYTYLDTSETSFLNEMLNLQNFSESSYLPVTEDLRSILEKFCETFKDEDRYKGEYADGEWLEMCYVYRHYREDHKKGEICFATDDPVKGMARFNALTAVESADKQHPTVNHVDVTSIYSYNRGGKYFTFTPSKPGVYKFYSLCTSYPDPYMVVGGSEISNDLSYNGLDNLSSLYNFSGYRYFATTDTVYLQTGFDQGTMGSYDFVIEYVGETLDWLRAASTAGGMFIGTLDESGNIAGSYYGAVPWGWNDAEGYYYTRSGNEFDTVLYIDFVHANYYETNNRSLNDMINLDYFNLAKSPFFGRNYTSKMKEFYQQSIEGKDPEDELYGMLEANEELVSIIAEVFNRQNGNGDGLDTGYWLSVACYYQHFGPAN